MRRRGGGHDPAGSFATWRLLADGGEALCDLRAVRDQAPLFGAVASDSTAYRAIEKIAAEPDLLESLRGAHAKARARAWSLGLAPKRLTIDLDATMIAAHSEKEGAAGNFKGGFGFHPMLAYFDETSEAAAAMLRPGNAGANTAADQVAVAEAAIEALPERAWKAALDADGQPRANGEVAEASALLDLSAWPEGSRVIVRRERANPGAQLSFTDADGHRFQAILTDQAGADIALIECRHRARARAEDQIRHDKDTGLAKLPFREFALNAVWLELVGLAHDLLAWTQALALSGELARCEPKRLRYRLLHVAARLAFSGRRAKLRLQAGWPWAAELSAAFARLGALPVPAG
jgi:Transposase DDE domain group 1